LTKAVAETDALAAAWGNVAKESAAAQRSLAMATAAAGRAALPPGAVGAIGAARAHLGRRIGIGGMSGGSGYHIGGPGIAVPGGGHINTHGGAMAAAGLVGYAGYEAAQMEDAIFQLNYHSGLDNNDANKKRFRKILQDAMKQTGFGLRDISESAKQEIRMFQGTPGDGLDVLPEMLKAAAIEARLKGESPVESMKALIGLAHMTKQYAPEDIKKLAPAFAFLSTANPGSLSSIERAAGYAVPLLQSGLEIDPMQSLLLGTALTRAGATSTKSGTWLREMALRAMPGTSMMTKTAFMKHEEALKAFGLVDDNDKPTWFTNGKPDIFKMLNIAGERATSIPLEKRAGYERQLFGAQGGGGFALLADPAVHAQIQSLSKEMNSPAFKNRYGSFMTSYNSEVTAQNARTAMQTFNVTMQDLGATVLPSVNQALKNMKSILEGITGVLPGAKDKGKIGGDALTGALGGAAAGFAIGKFGGPVGAVGGAVGGGILGGAYGFLEQSGSLQKGERPGDRYERRKREQKVEVHLPQQNVQLNIDGETIAQVILNKISGLFGHETTAPASDGSVAYGP
jgi:hypothetical protein